MITDLLLQINSTKRGLKYHLNENTLKDQTFESYNSSRGEEVGVVAAFLEVHDDVEQRHLVSSSFRVQSLKVFRQDKFVVLPATDKHTFTLFLSRCSIFKLYRLQLEAL